MIYFVSDLLQAPEEQQLGPHLPPLLHPQGIGTCSLPGCSEAVGQRPCPSGPLLHTPSSGHNAACVRLDEPWESKDFQRQSLLFPP